MLSLDIMWPHDKKDMWLGKWEPLSLSHYCVNYDAYRSCGNGDISFYFVTTYHGTTQSKQYVAW